MQGLLELQEGMPAGEWRECSDTAQVLACFLRCHPAVAEVRYPGLTSDPDYREASSSLRGGFGPLVRARLADDSPYGGQWIELDARGFLGSSPKDAVLAIESALA